LQRGSIEFLASAKLHNKTLLSLPIFTKWIQNFAALRAAAQNARKMKIYRRTSAQNFAKPNFITAKNFNRS
jgi:hypothetical protein